MAEISHMAIVIKDSKIARLYNIILLRQYFLIVIVSIQTGELIRVVAGENFSSTDLHIAGNGTLLVGQVAELTQIDPNDPTATTHLHNRKLQVSRRQLQNTPFDFPPMRIDFNVFFLFVSVADLGL